MDIVRFFPNVLGGTQVKYSRNNKKEILNFSKTLEYIPMYKDVIEDEFVKDKTKSEVSKLNKVIQHKKIGFLKDPLEMALKHFNNQIMSWKNDLVIVNSWFNKIKPNRESEIINQTNSLLTGILFLDVEDNHPHLIFEKEVCGFNPDVDLFNEFNMTKASIKPKSDYLVILPSSIKFKFSKNKSTKIHTNLMFSTLPIGQLGYNTTSLGIK